MILLLENDAMRVFLLDYGLIQVEDISGIIFATMATGPVGSLPGDNIKCMVPLPKSLLENLPFKQQVVFWLGRSLPSEGYIPSRAHGGDSLVTVGESVRVNLVSTTGKTVPTYILANEKGQLSGVGCLLHEDNGSQAEQVAYQLLSAILSTVAFEHRVPLFVQRVEVLDTSGETPWWYVTLGKSFTAAVWDSKHPLPTPELLLDNAAWRRALSFYRESLVLNLPMYRFLALYKGLEDLDRVRAFLYQKARKDGKRAKLDSAMLPQTQFFRQHFPDLAGKPVSEGERHLRTGFRNFSAHSVLNDGSYMTSDHRGGMVQYANLCSLADVTFRLLADGLKTFAESLDVS